jgi:hypothetical protein
MLIGQFKEMKERELSKHPEVDENGMRLIFDTPWYPEYQEPTLIEFQKDEEGWNMIVHLKKAV